MNPVKRNNFDILSLAEVNYNNQINHEVFIVTPSKVYGSCTSHFEALSQDIIYDDSIKYTTNREL